MSIRRTLVVSVAVCFVSLTLAGTPHAQSSLAEAAAAAKKSRAAIEKTKADLAAAEAKRLAAFATSPEGQRQAAIAAEKLRTEKLATARFAAAEKLAAEKLAAAQKAYPPRVAPNTPANTGTTIGNAQREELIKAQFSLWDGSHTKFTQAIKASMNDPSSYQHVNTTYVDLPGDRLVITTTFRGKNAFGAVVTNTMMGIVDLSGNVIDMTSR
jgi:hypothetical protein